ncbi:hypothetical protein ACMD2_11218 [Ananas comosus]|uniref:Protein FAR1-RELATED SEQUENCE n=1 Tax=Ananas comosus TaxID=4615 RepID=A0A199UMD2_ANACO|nr:hypothetical protein ACMD2_11218 [Ananas comosus]
MIEDGKWVVTAFVREHNHDSVVSPSKARFLRSHRSITNEQKDMIHMRMRRTLDQKMVSQVYGRIIRLRNKLAIFTQRKYSVNLRAS